MSNHPTITTTTKGGNARRALRACLTAITTIVWVGVVAGAPHQRPGPSGELIERTLAIVGGQVITLADARTAVALGLVDDAEGKEPLEQATTRLIDRALMLREVQHYSPPEPPDSDIQSRVELARQRFPSADAFAKALEAGGFSEGRLRTWIRDDLRIVAYLDQRFAAAGVPGDQEVAAYYAEHRAEFERGGVPFADALPLIRERLSAERRRELITDWVSDLRRRTEIIRISALEFF